MIREITAMRGRPVIFALKQLSSIAIIGLWAASSVFGQETGGSRADISPWLDGCNVHWDVPGPSSAESMPIGNGDIGLNVWTETNGDVAFYIGKSDSWNEDVFGGEGLMKLGGVRVSLNPNPVTVGAPFSQALKLHQGEIEIRQGFPTNQVVLRIWVDANNPVIHVEAESPHQPVSLNVSLIDWRLDRENPDTVPQGQTDRILWFHRNSSHANPHVANLTFGAVIKGASLTNISFTNLVSSAPATRHLVSIYPLTAQTSTADEWRTQLETQISRIDALDLEQTRQAHRDWWNSFWHRSWIFVTGDVDATKVTRGYVLQRFITACGGRGAYPIKFNGSLFVVDDPGKNYTADHRDWGGQYWFQNTRAMYWPRLAAGDFDIMRPLFKMYLGQVPGNSLQITKYYGHHGAYFAETAPFWGGLRYWGPEVKEDWTGHYFVPILELSMMMLDYYDYTGDTNFLQNTLLPITTAGLEFYDQHFARDAQGKILLDPVNAIEMYWKVRSPAPDIAGLRAVLPRMMALPPDLVSAATLAAWARMRNELPELPIGMKNGKKVILPYAGEQTARIRNGENPELYAIYPYRLYGVGKPDLQLAIDTFNARKMTQKGCWVQDPIQAAFIGLAGVAKEYIVFNLTRREPRLKFPAFWAKANDYPPDEDNGGNAEEALQLMLLQTEGKKILLLPAWPKGWNCHFKLNAPFQTTVQGTVQNGKLTQLIVNPPERAADVVDLSDAGLPR